MLRGFGVLWGRTESKVNIYNSKYIKDAYPFVLPQGKHYVEINFLPIPIFPLLKRQQACREKKLFSFIKD